MKLDSIFDYVNNTKREFHLLRYLLTIKSIKTLFKYYLSNMDPHLDPQ